MMRQQSECVLRCASAHTDHHWFPATSGEAVDTVDDYTLHDCNHDVQAIVSVHLSAPYVRHF